jgi:hypothetical protein
MKLDKSEKKTMPSANTSELMGRRMVADIFRKDRPAMLIFHVYAASRVAVFTKLKYLPP